MPLVIQVMKRRNSGRLNTLEHKCCGLDDEAKTLQKQRHSNIELVDNDPSGIFLFSGLHHIEGVLKNQYSITLFDVVVSSARQRRINCFLCVRSSR